MAYGENIFTGMIDEAGIIWDMATGRKRQKVGVDSQQEDEYIKTISEMQETIDNYYNKLIELGAIEIPKTPEEIASEQLKIAQEQAEQQAQINASLLEAINTLKNELGDLKNGFNGNGNEHSTKQLGQDSESNQSKSTGSKKRAGTKQENNS